MAPGTAPQPVRPSGQLTFDDLAPPLQRVTFVVFDLETTGGSAGGGDAITEIGAVKVRGGEVLGTFATLVNPGSPIPTGITYLTGITEAMVRPAPTVDAVLPAFLEWVGGDAVLVGHNVRFDVSFVRAACDALGYDRPANQVVDTCSLARRLLRDEVAPEAYAEVITATRLGLSSRPAVLLDPLAARMRALAGAARYEEAAAVRDRAAALSRAVQRQRRLEALRNAGRLVVEVDGEGGAVLDGGRLTLAWPSGPRPLAALTPPAPDQAPSGPLAASEVDELLAVAAWLDARAPRLHLLACDDGLSWPAAPVPSFIGTPPRRTAR